MKRIYFQLLVLLFLSDGAYACSCGIKKLKESQKREVENSDCIFVGRIMEVNHDLSYKIEVIESLDGGDLAGNVYVGKNWKYCYPYVENKGVWLVYAKMEEGILRINRCGLSRSFNNPITNTYESLGVAVDLLFKEEESTQEDYKKNSKIQRLILANEIIALRERRGYCIQHD